MQMICALFSIGLSMVQALQSSALRADHTGGGDQPTGTGDKPSAMGSTGAGGGGGDEAEDCPICLET